MILAALALSSSSAFANQATDGIHGAITCKAASGGFAVKISADRKKMTLIKANGSVETYEVSQTVGDTATWYAPNSGNPSLWFDDQGDAIQFRASDRAQTLICPQGKDEY
jgi:hypothetical protein